MNQIDLVILFLLEINILIMFVVVKEIIPGLYGPNCTTPCSKNCKNDTCDRTSGIYAKSCLNGYTGDHCIEGNYLFVFSTYYLWCINLWLWCSFVIENHGALFVLVLLFTKIMSLDVIIIMSFRVKPGFTNWKLYHFEKILLNLSGGLPF